MHEETRFYTGMHEDTRFRVDGTHEDTRFILVRAAERRNTLHPVRRSSCIMHQFVVGDTNGRERDRHPKSLV